MNKYKFCLKDYHAIKEAAIDIDGLTVIAGINGCGKSTIAKWLYAFVWAANGFSNILDEKLVENLERKLTNAIFSINNINNKNFIHPSTVRLKVNLSSADFNFENLTNIYLSKLNFLKDKIREIVPSAKKPEIEWIKKSLGIDDNLFADMAEDFYTKYSNQGKKLIQETIKKNQERDLKVLSSLIREKLDLYEGDFPQKISFKENDLNLINSKNFRLPSSLKNVVYIETPMSLSNSAYDNPFWTNLADDLMESPKSTLDTKTRKLIVHIQNIIGGKIIDKDLEYSHERQLRFVRNDDSLDIPLNDVATGIKSFAAILRLLQNGTLNRNSLLIIDEPEAHLHPQWIIDFAHILVLLNKELGIKLLLASHNPDMIAALQTISKALGIDDVTHFYEAVEDKENNKHQFFYNDLGNATEKIFESFNIALEKIEEYERRISRLDR